MNHSSATPTSVEPALGAAPISNILQQHLRTAMAIELATMPPYLYAFWSIRPRADGGSAAAQRAAQAIRSVVFEEMLHFGIAANVLNALGGTPAIPENTPTYPGHLPGQAPRFAFDVKLQRCSLAAIDLMIRIELPEVKAVGPLPVEGWETIGQFYGELEQQLGAVPSTAFHADRRQLPEMNNPGPARLVRVSNLADALTGLRTITDQGEGLDRGNDPEDGDNELAHYFKFEAVKTAIASGALDVARDVYPVIDNPVASAYTPDQQLANLAFNALYSELLDALQATLTSDAPNVYGASTGLMERLSHAAAVLRNQGFVPGTEFLAGPTFEYLPRERRAH